MTYDHIQPERRATKKALRRDRWQFAAFTVLAAAGWLLLGSLLPSCTPKAYHGQANARPHAYGLATPEPAAPRVSVN